MTDVEQLPEALIWPGSDRSHGSSASLADDPAPTVALGHNAAAWCWGRPSTAVMGDPRVAPPGYRGGHDERATTMMAGAIRVELAELAVLQDFPAGDEYKLADGSRCGWPFQGTRSDQAKIIGNAVPSGLAEAIVRAVTGQENTNA